MPAHVLFNTPNPNPNFKPPPNRLADPSWLEQRLMQHCVELKRAGTQPSLPLLGNFCLGLGLQMRVRLCVEFRCNVLLHGLLSCEIKPGRGRSAWAAAAVGGLGSAMTHHTCSLLPIPVATGPQGRLKPFLDRRRQLCTVSDDGRQHVLLTPAGAILGGGTTADAAPAAAAGAPAAAPAAPAAAPLARLAAGGLPGGSAGGAASTEQVAAAVMPGVAAAASAAKDYKK